MNKSRHIISRMWVLIFVFGWVGLTAGELPAIELEAGVVGFSDIDFDMDTDDVTRDNFYDYFTDNGPTTPSHTIEVLNPALFGAIWTDPDLEGEWREVRFAVDINNDGVYDIGEIQWAEEGTLTWVPAWNGEDYEGNVLPNGRYPIEIRVDENGDDEFSDTEIRKNLMIEISTATISGKVVDENGDPVQGAIVKAGSLIANNDATTNAQGEFSVNGLYSDMSYTLNISGAGKISREIEDIEIMADETETNIGAIALENAIFISGTIKLDQNANGVTDEEADKFKPFANQYGSETKLLEITAEAENTEGSGWGSVMVEINPGELSADFSIPIPQGEPAPYEIGVSTEGFAARLVTVNMDETGGNAGVIVLSKASVLKGSVKLPKPVTDTVSIDVIAVSAADETERYSGWGNINPFFVPGHCSDASYDNVVDCYLEGAEWTWDEWLDDPLPLDTGTFQLDGVPAGLYHVGIRIMGFKTKILKDIEILAGQDKDLGEIHMELGSVISGTLTIRGNTTGLPLNESDEGTDAIEVWINAWSPETDEWGGVGVRIERGENMSAAFEISGLNDGRYEIGAEIGEGYELVDAAGNMPVFVELSNAAYVNVALKPHEGVITGLISGDGVSVDLSKTAVQVMRPWGWLPPKFATVENGLINPATGAYTISGLGTDDYVVRAGVYDNLSDPGENGTLLSEPGVGVVTERVFVENDARNPTVFDIEFSRGYSVSGAISINAENPPWHDFGNGAGGTANGKKDTTGDMYDERVTIAGDLAGQVVQAVPVDMYFMSGNLEGADPLVGQIVDNGDGTGSYRIDGLSPGAYVIVPPFKSPRITEMASGTSDLMSWLKNLMSWLRDLMSEAVEAHHWVTETGFVVVADKDTDQNFVLGNGYTVTGRLTLPEAQILASDQSDQWNLIGLLMLFTPDYEFLGDSTFFFKMDFNNTAQCEFKFNHVAKGDYMLYFYSERYVVSSARLAVSNTNATVNLSVEKGVDLTGRLVDAETGEPVTAADGVTVMCEAVPQVAGSNRSTKGNAQSLSYIENGSGQPAGRPNNTPGKFHLTALPTGNQYVIVIDTENGAKTKGAKNYVNRVIAGIDIPEGATGEINVGTIELREGTTITGRLTDANGEPVPGTDVLAMPTDSHDGSGESRGESDDEGYYTIYGIDPDVPYYDLIAAERPWLFDDWGKEVAWGEERRYSVRPNATDPATDRTRNADFVLTRATASLSGTIAIPDSAQFKIPFASDKGDAYPSAYILLQKKGVAYKEMLDGIAGITAPTPEDVKTAEYRIDNIPPGKYKIIFMNYGLPRAEIDNITFAEDEEKTLNAAWDDDFYKISGKLALSGGGNPSGADVSGVVCMNLKERSVIFGRLKREADGTFSSYEVPGLAGSDTYQLIFYNSSGIDDTPEVFAVGAPFATGQANKNYDAVIVRDPEPVLILRAYQDAEDPEIVRIGIFSTGYLTDNGVEIALKEPTVSTPGGKLFLKTGGGTLDGISLKRDKRQIFATYRKSSEDTQIDIMACVHYGKTAKTKIETLSFNADTVALNSDRVSPYVSDRVKLGNGDHSRVYIPSGAMETSGGDNLTVSIEKTGADSSRRSAKSSAPSLPVGITLASDIYDITAKESGTGGTPKYKGLMTVQLEYDPTLTSDTTKLNVFHHKNGAWAKETANRSVDTDNATISVEVDGLSTFIVGEGELQGGGSRPVEVGEGDSSECFIRSVQSGMTGENYGIIGILVLFFIVVCSDRFSGQSDKSLRAINRSLRTVAPPNCVL